MSGGNFYQQPGRYPGGQQQPAQPQPGGYPQQGGYQPQGYPPQYAQPYGQAYPQPPQWQSGYVPPAYLQTEAFGGFWIRLVAYFIDALIIAVPGFAIEAAIYSVFGIPLELMFDADPNRSSAAQPAESIASLVQFAIGLVYWTWMTSAKGGTLGKLALGLRVVDDNGMHLGFGRSIGRYFAAMLSGCLCAIGYLMAGFHAQKRGLHDLIAGTYVVRKEFVNPQQLQA